jgi:K+:H+ antiporter
MSRALWRSAVLYLAMFPLTGAIFWVVCRQGDTLRAPALAPGLPSHVGSTAGRDHVEILPHLLLGMLTILLAARLVGWAFARLRQPPVMGEVVAGILLGPSVLGWVWPGAKALIFPPVVVPHLSAIAQVGVVLYMFLVGLELNPALIRGRARATVAISHASIVVPFALGSSIALFTYPRLSSSDVPFTSFALFSGVALSVTAFPVLARILSDRQLQASRLGVIALACAAAADVTAWCLLALVVGVVHAAVDQAILTIILAMVYLAIMLLICRPLVHRLVARFERAQAMTHAMMGAVFVALLASSLVTELIGIHALFGAFLLGAIVPPESRLAREVGSRLEDLVAVLLLPAFFAITGLRTEIGLVSGGAAWLTVGLLIVVASLGKFGGTYVAGRLTGLGGYDASALGIMMNTRGLMELIVLNIGLDLGILSPTLFSMFVVMALATTLMTTPIIDALMPRTTLGGRRARPAGQGSSTRAYT